MIYIVVTYSQFDSNIRVLYIFLGFLKNTWKYLKILDHRCLWVWAQLKLSLLNVLFIIFTYFTYSHFHILKYLKILLFEHLQKIRVFCMSLLWWFRTPIHPIWNNPMHMRGKEPWCSTLAPQLGKEFVKKPVGGFWGKLWISTTSHGFSAWYW